MSRFSNACTACAFVSVTVWSSAWSAAAQARDITLVTHRTAEWTELYVAAKAGTLFEVFDVPPTALTGADDRVDFGALRTGTAWLGDRLLETTRLRLGAHDAVFEAMSFMVHPADDKLPMTTPYEGLVAIGVCTGPEAGTHVSMSDLHAYVGYFAGLGGLDQPITLEFSQERTDALTVLVYEYDDAGLIATYSRLVAVGEDLVLDAPEPAPKGLGARTVAALKSWVARLL